MAADAFNLSAAANILKVRYLGPIREQLNNSTVLLSRIGRDDNSVSVSGKTFTVPLHTGRNLSAGVGRGDASTTQLLPDAGKQSYQVAVIPNCYQYGRIQVTGPTIAATRDNVGAFVKAIESEMTGLMRDMKKSFNRQLHGDGKDALAYWYTNADGTTPALVDDGRGNGFIHLPVGTAVVCDVIDATDHSTVLGDGISFTAATTTAGVGYQVAWSAGTVTTAVDGDDYIVLDGTLGYQLMGIAGIIDDGDPVVPAGGGSLTGLHGLAVGTYPFWKAQVNDNSGTNRALTLALMQAPLSLIAQNSDFSEEDVKFMLCSYGIRDRYYDLLVQEKRFVNVMKLDGGFTGLEFSGIPLIPDPQCKKNRIYYVVPESLKIYRTSDFNWMEKDGSTFSRVSNQDAYEATLLHYGNLGTTARNANALLDDISET